MLQVPGEVLQVNERILAEVAEGDQRPRRSRVAATAPHCAIQLTRIWEQPCERPSRLPSTVRTADSRFDFFEDLSIATPSANARVTVGRSTARMSSQIANIEVATKSDSERVRTV
jgi:hypothetical protein